MTCLTNQTLTEFEFASYGYDHNASTPLVGHPRRGMKHESCYGVFCINVRNMGKMDMDGHGVCF